MRNPKLLPRSALALAGVVVALVCVVLALEASAQSGGGAALLNPAISNGQPAADPSEDAHGAISSSPASTPTLGNGVWLPMVVLNWTALPAAPHLHPPDNPDGDGSYWVIWDAAARADAYLLQEALNAQFDGAVNLYSGSNTSFLVTDRGAARYYYRVRGRNAWGDGPWSATQYGDVLWEREPNDDAWTQANGPIVSGLTYYGRFPVPEDLKDYFYFDLAASHTAELWLTNIPANMNLDLVLRNSQLGIVAQSVNPGNQNEHIPPVLLSPGRYYVQVFHTSGGVSDQPYHLRVVYQ